MKTDHLYKGKYIFILYEEDPDSFNQYPIRAWENPQQMTADLGRSYRKFCNRICSSMNLKGEMRIYYKGRKCYVSASNAFEDDIGFKVKNAMGNWSGYFGRVTLRKEIGAGHRNHAVWQGPDIDSIPERYWDWIVSDMRYFRGVLVIDARDIRYGPSTI